ADVRLRGLRDLVFGRAVRRRTEGNRQDLWGKRVFAGAMAGAAGFGVAGRNDRSVIRAKRQRLGRHRRADFVKSQSMDVVGGRAPAGLRAGGGRDGAYDTGRATERRTLADFGAITVRRGRHLRFPFLAVGSDVVADPVHRAVADAAGKYTLHLLRLVSGGDGSSVGYVENTKTDAVECALARDKKIFSFPIRPISLAIRLEYRARRAG